MADDAATPDPKVGGPTADWNSPEEEEQLNGPITEGIESEGADSAEESTQARPAKRPVSVERLALVAGLVAVVVLTGLVGWLGFRAYEGHIAEAKRNLFLQVARQCAVNLSTVDYEHADADVQRILDSATGTFYDNFSHRSKAFVDNVKQAHSKLVGTVAEAGLESQAGDEGHVLVAVTVTSSNPGTGEEQPQNWRMRITVQQMGDGAKVSNIAFVL
jgi:Mce-associated membrane protein